MALILLVLGGFLAGVGWIAGVVLLWMSSRWTVGEKLLGTLVWPGGIADTVRWPDRDRVERALHERGYSGGSRVLEECAASTTNPVGIILFVVAVLAPLVVATILGIRAARRPG